MWPDFPDKGFMTEGLCEVVVRWCGGWWMVGGGGDDDDDERMSPKRRAGILSQCFEQGGPALAVKGWGGEGRPEDEWVELFFSGQ